MTTSGAAAGSDTAWRRGARPVRDGAGEQVVTRLVAAEEPPELVDHDPEEARPARRVDARDVWRQEHVRKVTHGRIGGDRLRIEDVERSDQLSLAQLRDQR